MSRGYAETRGGLMSPWRPHHSGAPKCPRHSFYFCLLDVREVGLTSSISVAVSSQTWNIDPGTIFVVYTT